jgi:hypothetical protein
MKWVLSKMISTTWLIFPPGELSWQLTAGLGDGGGGAAGIGDAPTPAGTIGYKASIIAVPMARARRRQPDQAIAVELFLSPAEMEWNFILTS